MSTLRLTKDDSFIKVRVNKDDLKDKFIEVEFHEIIGEDVTNTITTLAGIIGETTGTKPENVLLDIITSISTEPMIQLPYK